jgi:hypothetical protein
MALSSSLRLCVLAALGIGLAACGGGGGATSAASSTGQISIALTDAPMDDAAEVVVVFTGVQVHGTDGQTRTLDFGANRKSIDLMKLRNGVTSALTEGFEVPAGSYDWMRLTVLADKNSQGESYIKLVSGAQYPLWIPSGSETGLKLVRPITVAQGSITRLIVDFDLRKSVHAPPGQDPNYILRPTLRLLDQIQVGKITATVDLAALTKAQLGTTAAITTCKAGLYLFAGAAAMPDDQDLDDSDGKDPVFYAPLVYDGVSSVAQVNIPFVEAGAYTVAATCNFDVDAADANDYNPAALAGAPGYQTMRWTTVGNVLVTAGAAAVVAVP